MNPRTFRLLLFVFGCLLGISTYPTLRAEDFYIAQSTQGNGSGASAANARSVDWFNNSANWSSPTKSPGKIGPGDRVRLVGTISSPLTFQAGGTPTAPISLLFEANSKLSAPFWEKAAISISGSMFSGLKNHIVIDGGGTGVIESTANGTELQYQKNGSGISAVNVSHLSVKNLTIRNIFVRVKGTSPLVYGSGIFYIGDNVTSTDLLIDNCVIHDMAIGINIGLRGEASNYVITNNEIFNCNWGGTIADRTSATVISNVTVANNRFRDWINWDGTDSASHNMLHHNGFFFRTATGGRFLDVSVYNNVVGPNYTSISPNGATSGFYFSGSGMIGPMLVYNNVFVENQNDTPSNGNIFSRSASNADMHIYNNTFLGGGSGIAIGFDGTAGGKLSVANNVSVGKTLVYVSSASLVDASIDHNSCYNAPGEDRFPYSWSLTNSGAFKRYPDWKQMGNDVNGFGGLNPGIDSKGRPIKGSILVDSGKDLSKYFKTDKDGVIRPVGAGWDIGAYESLEGLTGIISTPSADSDQLAVIEPSTSTNTDPIVIDLSPEPEPVTVVDSGSSKTSSSQPVEETVVVKVDPAPAPGPTSGPVMTAPIIVATATSSTSAKPPVIDGSTSSGHTLEPPPATTKPVIVADSSTSAGSTSEPAPASSSEPAPGTSSSIMVVESPTSTEPAPKPGKGNENSKTRGNSGKPVKVTTLF